MKLRPLSIGAKRTTWRGEGGESKELDEEFRSIRYQVLDRDDRTCQFCGLRAMKWQEVHHLDDDHSNNAPGNLVTACHWCHMVHHVGLVGVQRTGLLAIHPDWPECTLPEQWRLHHLCRAIITVRDALKSGHKNEHAQEMLSDLNFLLLEESVDMAADLLGTSDPAVLGDYLRDISDEEYAQRGPWLASVRLIPLLDPDELRVAADPKAAQQEMMRREHWSQILRQQYGLS